MHFGGLQGPRPNASILKGTSWLGSADNQTNDAENDGRAVLDFLMTNTIHIIHT